MRLLRGCVGRVAVARERPRLALPTSTIASFVAGSDGPAHLRALSIRP
jgi:hypothetical protein